METTHRFLASDRSGEVSAILTCPPAARWLYVLGHGAGAGMLHPFLECVAARLAGREVATFRYQFPYMEAGRRRPDHAPTLVATVRSAVAEAQRLVPDLPLIAGGKSMGGRMTSTAAAEESLPGVRGLVFLGFPLHPAGRSGIERGMHLFDVELPMLFLQGDRDHLAELGLLRPICERLWPGAALHVVEGGDHSFQMLKRSGRSEEEVMDELGTAVRAWCEELTA